MADTETRALATRVLAAFRARGGMLVAAESCTGGLLTGALTDIPGSSDVVWGGFVTYAYEAKTAMIGVDPALLATDGPGAVSEEVARAMAEGALAFARKADGRVGVAIAITGVAGPDASEAKPVGLVHFAIATPDGTRQLKCEFGNHPRDDIRAMSVRQGLQLLLEAG